jgi:uncharacterized repeat protein (TIGR03803 family)
MKCWTRSTIAGFLFGVVLFPALCQAQGSFSFLHKFHTGGYAPIGRLAEAPDGSLYGTTFCGGEPLVGCQGGTLFVLRPQLNGTWAFETLNLFRPGLEGSRPFGGVTIARDGNLYGVATLWGQPTFTGNGTIFRRGPSGSVSAVHHFTEGSRDTVGPLLEASDGNLYGGSCRSNFTGGTVSTLFRLTPAGSFTTIHAFPRNPFGTSDPFDPVEGFCPFGSLTERDGFLFGTTMTGGQASPVLPQLPRSGTLFRVDPRITPAPLSVLHTFHGFDGATPVGGVTAGLSNDFYGTTLVGGLFGQGVVYRLDSAGVVRPIHTFFGLNGAYPFGQLARSTDGSFYGTTLAGGFGHGTLFRVGASGMTTLHWFTGASGSGPIELIQARDGNLYGATTSGGPGGGGTIFRLASDNSVTTLHAFSGQPRWPQDGVVQDADGNLYGPVAGSSFGAGAVYKLTPSGGLSILHEFAAPARSSITNRWVGPRGLTRASDGFLYGRTLEGGAFGFGIVYRISPTGTFTELHSFGVYNGGEPLIEASDGNLYGAISGSAGTGPSIFRITRSGAFSTLISFSESVLGSIPGRLAEGPDGALYGIGNGPGPFNSGGLFRVTISGAFSLLHSFESSPEIGSRVINGLIRSADGGLYGATTTIGFPGVLPAIFRFDPVTNSIAAVARVATEVPISEGRDGAIYGWEPVPDSGVQPRTRLFRIAEGQLEYLYETNDADGLRPSAVIQGADGALYGTMGEGPWRISDAETWRADTFAGGIFRITVPPVSSRR